MLFAWITARGFFGLAKGVWLVIAIAALIAGFVLWLDAREDAAVEADRARSNAEAVTTAREADQAASEAQRDKLEDVEHGNDRAREAAAGSDDPLRDALEWLRPQAGGGS